MLTVHLTTYEGRREHFPLDRSMITTREGRSYIPVYLLHIDKGTNAALVSLPVEADSGAYRVWVRLAGIEIPPMEASA